MREVIALAIILVFAVLIVLEARKRRRRIAVFDEEGETSMGKPLTNTNTRTLNLVPEGPTGKRDKIQAGSMKAESSDATVCAVALKDGDEFTAVLTPGDNAESQGEIVFTFTADADLGDGVATITGTYSCAIVGEQATVIVPEEGADTPKP